MNVDLLLYCGTVLGLLLAVLSGFVYLNRRYKRAEENLRASEMRFRRIMEADMLGMIFARESGEITRANDAFLRLLGYGTDDLEAGRLNWRKLTPPEFRELDDQAVREMAAKGACTPYEKEYFHRDGSRVPILLGAATFSEPSEGGVAFVLDLTERKRAEAELRQMRYSVDRAGDSIFWVSRDGRILYANEAAWKTRGYSREEMLGLRIFDLDPDYQPGVWEQHFEELQRRGTITLETRHRTKDGRSIPIEVNANYVFLDGEPFNFATVRDITARKAMEQARLQSLSLMSSTLESTTDGILVVNTEGTIEIFNRNFVRMWRVPEEVLATRDDHRTMGLILDQLCEPEQFAEKVRFLYAHPEEESFDVIEFKDGRVFERYSRPQRAGEHVVGRVWSFRDTTARRQAEAERAKLVTQLHHSQKLEAVGTLAGGIAHDFNNILSGIYGYLGLAQSAAVGLPELQGYLEEIRRAGHRAADLVRQILAFSRTQGGDQAKSAQSLDHIVAEAVNLLRAASPTSIEIVTEIAQRLPAVWGNATQLHQVIMNLGTNAIQAMGDRPGRLNIGLEACSVDEAQARTLPGLGLGPHLRLTVRDTGAGMDASTRERAFEPFFTTKAPGEGTGLGLSVVHGIVRHHDGAIRLQSEVGCGTQFEIFLPAHLAGNNAPLPAAAAIRRGQGERILIVDDEVAITVTGKRALENLGYRVETENSALLALERIAHDPQGFQLVVSDLSMPEMTGLEFAARLRAQRADLPVILTSGNSVALTPERTQAVGVREVLPKPYTVATLVEVVQRNLG